MNRIQLPQAPVKVNERIQSPAWGMDANGVVCIRCNCGQWMRLGDDWTIDKNGDVNPSIHHAVVNSGRDPIGVACGWHEFVTFIGYHSR